MTPVQAFQKECDERVEAQGKNTALKELSSKFTEATIRSGYSYNFTWMGRPIIQYPQDMVAMQEIIWEVKPDLIIETGIAHGGSLIYYASLLELIGKGEVLGIDIDIRPHNRAEIEKHPMFKRISMIEGSAISESIVEQAKQRAAGKKTVMVCLDSNHTHAHVLKELELYSPLVTAGSFLVAFDTVVEDLPRDLYADRPWSVWAFVAALVGLGISLWRLPRSIGGFTTGLAFTLLLFFAFNKQAFCNYYTLVIGALAAAAAALTVDSDALEEKAVRS